MESRILIYFLVSLLIVTVNVVTGYNVDHNKRLNGLHHVIESDKRVVGATPPFPSTTSRRNWFMMGISAAMTTSIMPKNAQAVITSKYCAYGTGDGCEELAGGNELIRQLQEKSAANKEAIQLEARNAYYMKNYPEFFNSIGKHMVKKPDGTFMIVNDEEFQALKDDNKIGLEYASTLGGKTRDLTQKPILILKE